MEKTGMTKRFIISVLVAYMSICLIACGSRIDETEITPIAYRLKTIEIPDNIIASDVVITDDAVYYLDSAGVIRIDYDGKIEELFSLSKTESFACLFIDETGNFNVLAKNFGEDEKTITSLTVRRFSPGGNSLPRTNLDPFAESEVFPYPVNFLIKDDYYYVQSMSGVYVYDMSGSLVYEALGDGDTFSKSLFVLDDGRVGSASARFESNGDSFITRVYDIGEKDFDEYRVNVSGSVQDAIITNGGATGLLLGDSTGLYEFGNRLDGTLDRNRYLLLNFLERGVSAGDIMDIHKTLDGDIIIILRFNIAFAGDILVFSEWGEAGTLTAEGGWTEEEDIDITNHPNGTHDAGLPKVKEVITLAIPRFGSWEAWLQQYIAAFNKTNADYMIEVVSYMENDNEVYEDALKRFSIDIGTGQIADITAFPGSRVPIYSYTSKGIFVDLYELMENDPDFNKTDYLPGVFEALETDGRLYTIFPLFNLVTVAAKTSETGRLPGWTIDEFIDYLDSKPEAEEIIWGFSRAEFIYWTSFNYFADRETGRMTFDRGDFMKILQAAQRFPINESKPRFDIWWRDKHSEMPGAKSGDPLMIDAYIHAPDGGRAFRTVHQYEYFFGEEFTYIGLPTPDGSGTFFAPAVRFAIAKRSAQKEGAWQFIKFMMDNYITHYVNSQLPVKLSELEKMAHDAMFDFDNRITREIQIDNEVFITMDRDNTPEENQKLWDLLFATNRVQPSDMVVSSIIGEEIRAYVAGQKSAEMVMDIIENRVNLYLSEME